MKETVVETLEKKKSAKKKGGEERTIEDLEHAGKVSAIIGRLVHLLLALHRLKRGPGRF